MGLDENMLLQSVKGEKKSSAQVLKNVVVPANTRSSLRSSLSSVRDQSTDYDTPATSLAVTPAESLVKEEITDRVPIKIGGSHVTMNSRISPKGKRKRTADDELFDTDARLAQVLQEEEYEQEQTYSKSRKYKRSRVEDSEDEPFSSSAPKPGPTPNGFRSRNRGPVPKPRLHAERFSEEYDDDAKDDGTAIEFPRTKNAKMILPNPLPSRAARDTAKKSMKDPNPHQILDSEDDNPSDDLSDLSLFSSEYNSDAFEESGLSSEDDEIAEGPSITATAMAVNSTAPVTVPVTANRRRRAPAARNGDFHRSRISRRREDRVSRKTPCLHT